MNTLSGFNRKQITVIEFSICIFEIKLLVIFVCIFLYIYFFYFSNDNHVRDILLNSYFFNFRSY